MEDLPRLIVTPVRRSEDFAAGSAIHAAAYRTGTALKHTDGSVVDFSHRTECVLAAAGSMRLEIGDRPAMPRDNNGFASLNLVE